MAGIKQILKDVIAGPAEYSTRVWKYFPYPRVDTVIIRQRLRSALPRVSQAAPANTQHALFVTQDSSTPAPRSEL